MNDVFSGDYVRHMDSLPRTRFRWLVPALGLKGTEQLVDFGCGSGSLLDAVHDKVAHYTGVDFSPDFIDYARRRVANAGIRNATFVCEQIVRFCESHPEAFDLAVSVDVAGYLDDAEFVRIHRAIRGCLRPNGRLCVYMANGAYFLERLKRKKLAPANAAPYLTVRRSTEYVNLLRSAGFGDVRVSFTPHYNVLRFLHPLAALPVVGRAFEAKVLLECRP